ncbi:phosphoribosylformylglycinamidine synthase [Rhodopirellula rubra]|uniref:Phosphoribosylformylglycinamidine synthase n=1 Tax=Aporhodopirellula rubra TaxID=980271 RepID=A0A7W5DWT5_9BACT|nr:phosphoribosylformylglycinamidine synthase I [Aporhodopirellula rubra]MBB3205996.1 phosphoribosylformylglycinamidine synthase [Aporhodopirellula rubra]
MAAPRVLVLRAPGTNCDVETAHAFELAGATAERIHVGRLTENPALHKRYQILCIPGGFSYGDDIAAGRILATRMRHHLDEMIHHFVDSGDNLVLGICNGMQVLMRLGVLTTGVKTPQLAEATAEDAVASPSDQNWGSETNTPEFEIPPATLTWNNHGRFEDRWVHLAVDKTPCVFLKDIDQMYLPMAHAEGKFVARDADALEQLRAAGRLAIRYCDTDGQIQSETLPFPINPNGGDANVAGVCDASGRVFGLMPHPERHIDATQHPFWTRRKVQPEHGDGLQMFRNAVQWFA